ncbi:hypothetical protein AA313_de0200246 [Arthrobotrys entomopaga]|nr:hypothetical protein AA313_de0200246 [Arthrobotrys entomopaga]
MASAEDIKIYEENRKWCYPVHDTVTQVREFLGLPKREWWKYGGDEYDDIMTCVRDIMKPCHGRYPTHEERALFYKQVVISEPLKSLCESKEIDPGYMAPWFINNVVRGQGLGRANKKPKPVATPEASTSRISISNLLNDADASPNLPI